MSSIARLLCSTILTLVMSLSLCGCHSSTPRIAVQYTYRVIHVYPHDPKAFTEGLFYDSGFLYESTGIEGQSSIRQVAIATGDVIRDRHLPPTLFGEGITKWNDSIVQLTYQAHLGIIYNLSTFQQAGTFHYKGDGWGITHDASRLIMSDGSPQLRFINPNSFSVTRAVTVTAEGKPLWYLNELEWINGEIYANVWMSNRIARIDPNTGIVVGWIDLSNILAPQDRILGVSGELNGIAYDPVGGRLFVTGKGWPKLFEIAIVKLGDTDTPTTR